ncbi:MAG: hypothetical protein EOO82_02660, partial [Oxalobacteraceae bacterium]
MKSDETLLASRLPLSRAALAARSGVPNTVLPFWLRSGLLHPINASGGRGHHLRFEWYEANIAAVMNQLRILGVRIEGMLSITAVYRQAIAWAARYGIDRYDAIAVSTVFSRYHSLEIGEYNEDDLALSLKNLGQEQHGRYRITDRIKAIHAIMPMEELQKHLEPFL